MNDTQRTLFAVGFILAAAFFAAHEAKASPPPCPPVNTTYYGGVGYVEQQPSYAQNQMYSAEAGLLNAQAAAVATQNAEFYNDRHRPEPYVLPTAPPYTGGPL